MKKRNCKPKYERLGDREWLHYQYSELRLGMKEIAELVGCDRSSVGVALRRHGIPRRTATEGNRIKYEREGSKSRLYTQLNDPGWLRQKYCVEKLSLNQIAKLVGARRSNSVGQALKRFGLVVRTISEGLIVANPKRYHTDKAWICDKEVIEGSLLGDGGLRRHNRFNSESYAAFYKRNKFLDHVTLVASALYPGNFDGRIKPETHSINGKSFTYYLLSSYAHKELLQMDEQWYPASNNFKKVVPADLVLTPKIMLHWFMDDGSTSWRKSRKTLPVGLVFCSESFTLEEQEFLCEQMREFDLKVRVTPYHNQGTGWRIKMAAASVEHFWEVIGPPPVPSLAYKWKLPGGQYFVAA